MLILFEEALCVIASPFTNQTSEYLAVVEEQLRGEEIREIEVAV